MARDDLFLLVFFVVAALLAAVMAIVVVSANRALAAGYLQKAMGVDASARAEGLLYAEDGVRSTFLWWRLLAVKYEWPLADVRVTQSGVFLLPYAQTFGRRVARPPLALYHPSRPPPHEGLCVGVVVTRCTQEGASLLCEGVSPGGNVKITLPLRDPRSALGVLAPY